uniref:Kinesin-like protein n=1 Tax=Melopsittacus undulatus TaxID=13146 RepID=A0A8C6IUX2_MELUD
PGRKRVHTFVRVKPTADFAQDMIKFGPDNKSIEMCLKKDAKKQAMNSRQTNWSFRMDGILHNTSQEQLYETVAKKLVSEALIGYNGMIMCYGQTGAGKTYTMMGTTADYKHRGIIPRAIQQVFKATAQSTDPLITVRISYLEIYNETLFDLLSTVRSKGSSDMQMAIVDCPEGVYVKGLSIHTVNLEEDALSLLFEGENKRAIAKHALNKYSSRSHCIFTIYIEVSSFSVDSSDAKCVNSKINLIDLAGSERLSKSGSEGQLLKEAMYINKSLSFLEQVITALADTKRDHIPFRQSKLTYVLKDSLGRNCNTVIVANVCGEAAYMEHTLSSLRFATRMKWVTIEPVPNETHDREVCREGEQRKANRGSLVTYDPLSHVQIEEIKSQVHRYLKGAIDEIDILNLRQIQEVFKQFKLILSQQECEVEERLRSKYALIDKNDFVTIAALHKVMSGAQCFESATLVPAARSGFMKNLINLVHLSSPVRKEGARSNLSWKDVEGDLPSKSQVMFSTQDLDVKEVPRDQDTANIDAELSKPSPVEDSQQPSSPPPKPAAFEMFKEEYGSEISRIFKENKSILLDRKKRRSTVTQRINSIKLEMESIKKALEDQQQERWQQGEYVDEKGHIIIDEKEFLLIVKLKELKKEYRSSYAELQDLKAEIEYCQDLVNKCRRKLISEFEIWYNESFLIPKDVQEALKPGGNIRPGMIPINRVMCLEEDVQERFEQMQETMLPACPASVPFYKAKMRTDQKVISGGGSALVGECWCDVASLGSFFHHHF